MKQYPDWLRKAAAKGGKISKRKLSKREARRIALLRWGAGAKTPRAKSRAKTHNSKVSDGGPLTPESKQDANPPFAAPLG